MLAFKVHQMNMSQSVLDVTLQMCVCVCHLCDQELGDPLREAPFLTGQDHLQHVSMELLHDDKHSLGGLKHAVQVNHAWVV